MRLMKRRYVVIRKVEKFFSNFITCWGRRNAFCDSHICLCHPCVMLRLLLRFGRLPFVFGVSTKYGAHYYYSVNGCSCNSVYFYPKGEVKV
jgi:hypothetical protein